MIFTKVAHQSAKFQTFNCSDEISPNLYFARLLLLKVYKISAKKYIGHTKLLMIQKSGAKFEEKIFCFKNDKNLVNFDPGTMKSKIVALWLFILCRLYNVWPKKVHRIYNSWRWGVMENLKKIWLVVWKMTWGILQIFIRTLESVKISTFIGSFCLK